MRFHNAHAQRSLAAETWQNIQIYAIQHNTTVFDIAQLPKIRSTHRWAEVTQVGLPGIRYLTELSTWLPHKRHSHKNIGSWISGFHWFCIFLGIYNRKRFIWGLNWVKQPLIRRLGWHHHMTKISLLQLWVKDFSVEHIFSHILLELLDVRRFNASVRSFTNCVAQVFWLNMSCINKR